MEKIKVTVCTGTACFVMGASELMLLEEKLPPDLKDKVEISGEMCMNECKGNQNKANKPPFAKINDELICQANVPQIIDRLRQLAQI